MLFGKLKKAIRKLFGLEKPKVKYYAEVKGWPDKWEYHPPPCAHPPPCKESITLLLPRKPPPKASPKHFKPRTAHEKRLLNPKAKLEEEN
jgi:hypothetical protein